MLWLLACTSKTPPLAAEPLPVSTAEADLVLFFASEQRGNIDVCGCEARPRGGLARSSSWIETSRGANPGVPDLVLMAGGSLMEQLSPGENERMQQAMDLLGVDAANLSAGEVPSAVAGGIHEVFLSANIEGLPGSRRMQRGELDIAVVGVTRLGSSVEPAPGFRVVDPVEAGVAELRRHPHADVLILLTYGDSQLGPQIAEQVPELDVIIDARMHQGLYQPVDLEHAVLVRSPYQGLRLGELRLQLGEDGQVEGYASLSNDLDDSVPRDPRYQGLLEAQPALGTD